MNTCNIFRNFIGVVFRYMVYYPLVAPILTLMIVPIDFFIEGDNCEEGKEAVKRTLHMVWVERIF